MESGFRASVSAECFQHGHSHQDHRHVENGGEDKSAPDRHPSNVLHPVIDLETGETGEALLADLPHGRLGVAHRVGVLDPSTGQLLSPSSASDRTDGGMEVFAASNDVFFAAFQHDFDQALGTSEPALGTNVLEAHSHSHSHSHGHHHSHSHNEVTMSQVSGITEDEETGK